jgi:predicted ATPase
MSTDRKALKAAFRRTAPTREARPRRSVDQLPPQRLLTIIGPGGIGKTSVALAVAEALLATYDHGIRLIELSPLADPRLVSTVPAETLDLEIGSDNALPGLVVAAKPGDSSTPK